MNRKLAGAGIAMMLAIGIFPGATATAATACPRPLPQGSPRAPALTVAALTS